MFNAVGMIAGHGGGSGGSGGGGGGGGGGSGIMNIEYIAKHSVCAFDCST